MIDKILQLLGIRPRKTKERWYKVVRNGTEYWESETFRRNEDLAAAQKAQRTKLRIERSFNEHDVVANADLLMELLEECYQFGDPTFRPDVIYRRAGEKFGFEPDYVGTLVNNLVHRKLVRFEYDPNPNLHPKDSLDYWRLHKNHA